MVFEFELQISYQQSIFPTAPLAIHMPFEKKEYLVSR